MDKFWSMCLKTRGCIIVYFFYSNRVELTSYYRSLNNNYVAAVMTLVQQLAEKEKQNKDGEITELGTQQIYLKVIDCVISSLETICYLLNWMSVK